MGSIAFSIVIAKIPARAITPGLMKHRQGAVPAARVTSKMVSNLSRRMISFFNIWRIVSRTFALISSTSLIVGVPGGVPPGSVSYC